MNDPFPFLESAHNLVAAIRRGDMPEEIASWFGGKPIIGDVNLTGIEYPHRLTLHNCKFWGQFKAEDARFGNTLDLTGCRFQKGLLLDGSKVDGNVILEKTVIFEYGPDRFVPAIMNGLSLWQIRVGGSLLLTQSHINGRAWLADARIDGRVSLNGFHVEGDLNLQGAEIGADLHCRSLSASEPRPEIGGMVSMSGAKVGGQAVFSGVKIAKDLRLQNAEIGENLHCRSLSASEPRPEIGGMVSMSGAKVGGQADFSGVKITKDLRLHNANIGGNLLCRSLSNSEPQPEIGGMVWMSGTKVGGQATFNGVKITKDLNLQGAEIGADLICRSLSASEPRPEIGGMVSMLGTKVGGQADFRGVKVTGDLKLQGAEIGTGLLCRSLSASEPRPEIGGMVSMLGTKVGGQADFSGVKITKDLFLYNAEIEKNLLCRSLSNSEPQPEIGGMVSMSGAKVNGQADFRGVKVTGDLNLQNAEIEEDLDLSSPWQDQPRTEVGKGVNLAGVQVDGVTAFVGAKIGGQLSAVRATFDDGLYLGAGTAILPSQFRGDQASEIKDGIDLAHARVNARLSFAGLTMNGDLSLHDARIDGDLDGASTSSHPTCLKSFTGDGLRVGGNLNLSDIKFDGMPDRPCLDLSFAEIQGDCALPGGGSGLILRLYHSRLGEVRLKDHAGSSVVADGLSFRRLTVRDDDFCQFLASTNPFQKGTYETVERYLRDRGEDEQADLVFREMRRRDRRQELPERLASLDVWLFDRDRIRRNALTQSRAEARKRADGSPKRRGTVKRVGLWAWDVFLDVTTGCGTRSYRLSTYLVISCLVMWVMFLNPESVKREIHPTAVEMAERPTLAEKDTYPAEADKEWGGTEAGFAALRTVIPLMGDLPHAEWQPSSQTAKMFGVPIWFKYETLAGLVHALSYVVLPLFLASITGWLKKRGE